MSRGRRNALKRAAKLVAATHEAPLHPPVAPLTCPSCSAPVPLGDGDVATCAFCKAAVPLPAEYRDLRAAEQQRSDDRSRAEQLFRELGTPPSAALRAWAQFATFATTAVFAALIAVMAACSVLILLAGFALELVLHALAGPFGIDFIDRYGGGTVYAGFAILLIVGVLVPAWATRYFDSLAQIRRTLQANLAAVPPRKPGFPATCRGCGAALDVPAGGYGVRCTYCQSDNIVSLPAEWIARVGAKQATFHRSIVAAAELAATLRAEARAGLPRAAKWCIGSVVVFGLIGRGCSGLDSEDLDFSWKQSMASPRTMLAYDVSVPIDQPVVFQHLSYTIALRHRETLVWSSTDEGWGGALTIKNTTSFPFTTKSWEAPWLPRTDGSYAATFTAPYTGLFMVSLRSHSTSEGGTHLRWSVDAAAPLGVPSPPAIASAAGEAVPVATLPAAAQALADKLTARIAVTAADRSDLLVTTGRHGAVDPNIVVTSISTGHTEKTFDREAPIVALAIARDGHAIATATRDAIVPGVLEDRLFDSGNEAELVDSGGTTALAFVDKTVFASGGADGVIKLWDTQRGMQLYALPRLPGAIASLTASADGLTLTARYAGGARSYTVKTLAGWRN